MLEALDRARVELKLTEDVVKTGSDFSDREIEVWQHMPYLYKLNETLNEMTKGDQRIAVRTLRGLLAVGAFTTALGNQLFGETQVERDLDAINAMLDEHEQEGV